MDYLTGRRPGICLSQRETTTRMPFLLQNSSSQWRKSCWTCRGRGTHRTTLTVGEKKNDLPLEHWEAASWGGQAVVFTPKTFPRMPPIDKTSGRDSTTKPDTVCATALHSLYLQPINRRCGQNTPPFDHRAKLLVHLNGNGHRLQTGRDKHGARYFLPSCILL